MTAIPNSLALVRGSGPRARVWSRSGKLVPNRGARTLQSRLAARVARGFFEGFLFENDSARVARGFF